MCCHLLFSREFLGGVVRGFWGWTRWSWRCSPTWAVLRPCGCVALCVAPFLLRVVMSFSQGLGSPLAAGVAFDFFKLFYIWRRWKKKLEMKGLLWIDTVMKVDWILKFPSFSVIHWTFFLACAWIRVETWSFWLISRFSRARALLVVRRGDMLHFILVAVQTKKQKYFCAGILP